MNEPPIVIAAFGSTSQNALKTYEKIVRDTSARFKNHTVKLAFTSNQVRSKLKLQGIEIDSPEEAIQKCSEDGHNKMILFSLHIVPGYMDEILKRIQSQNMTIVHTQPLLYSDSDLEYAASHIINSVNNELAIVVVHGNRFKPYCNKMNLRLCEHLKAQSDSVFVCSIEGEPGTDAFDEIRKRNPKSVKVIPLMVVSGEHILEDVMGDGVDSWKNQLNIKLECLPPVGEDNVLMELFFKHLREAVKSAVSKSFFVFDDSRR